MLDQISTYFSAEIVYLWLNIGVIPFWLMLIFLPNSKLGNIFISSVFPIFILSLAYIFMIYKSYLGSYDFFENFNLYLGINNLSDLFSNQEFLIPFWIHFLAINLFCGSWMSRDGSRLLISKYLMFFPLLITYFIGPLGIFIYWIIRIFYAKKISLYD
tara:strand:+ start:6433 stop:6906 length:474 start_codon:yes stop_codon:yes gene_type:complete